MTSCVTMDLSPGLALLKFKTSRGEEGVAALVVPDNSLLLRPIRGKRMFVDRPDRCRGKHRHPSVESREFVFRVQTHDCLPEPPEGGTDLRDPAVEAGPRGATLRRLVEPCPLDGVPTRPPPRPMPAQVRPTASEAALKAAVAARAAARPPRGAGRCAAIFFKLWGAFFYVFEQPVK